MRKQTKLVAVLSAAALLAIGASMTSFAATKGWVQEGEDWVYLDKEGNREANVWRRSGDNYYYLDDDGIMARDTLVIDDTIDATYYVDENGVRITNAWKELPNDEGAQVGSENSDDTPEVLYYYFGSSGKAYTAGNEKKVREINGNYYMFNEEGQMLSGWQKGAKDNIYYLGTAREGWAYKDWQHLEPNDYLNGEDYDELEWFFFGTNGKAYTGSKYISGKYYHFDDNGIMDDDWYGNPASQPTAASGAMAFASLSGTQASGWVYTGDANLDADIRYDNDDMYWYYLVTVRDGGKIARSIPYNYQSTASGSVMDAVHETTPTGYARAMVIKNKTYMFNSNGKMLKGFVVIDDKDNLPVSTNKDTKIEFAYGSREGLKVNGKLVAYNFIADTKNAYERKLVTTGHFAGADKPFGYVYDDDGAFVTKDGKKMGQPVTGGRTLLNGLYYFNEASGSVQGQMQTGRTAITKDGEIFYYYFSKDTNYPGYAYTDMIQDGYLYGSDGKCVTADAGNSYTVYELPNPVWIMNKKDATTGIPSVEIPANSRVIVSRTGKVKTGGTVTIDGVKYTIDNANYTIKDEKPID